MIDVDLFKQFNDRYGHQAGDQCLRTIAAAIKECVRGTDIVARYGGEEFTMVLPDADPVAAHRVAQRARDGILALGLPHAGSPHRVVTVSIGVSTASSFDDGTPEQLIEAADRHLYRAKHNGRNQVQAG
jgi:diguanylate cyclase (GGDEF)-like protein